MKAILEFIKKNGKPAPKINGSIGYFNLSDWWLNELSSDEQNLIINKFQPMGSNGSSIIEGNITHSSQTVIMFLGALSGWFDKKDERYLAHKILTKAESLIKSSTPVLDIHFHYTRKQQLTYKDRHLIPNGFKQAVQACEQHIAIAAKAAQAFKQEKHPYVPSHSGYKQLAIIKEQEKNYSEAISLCKQALSQGWSGDWSHRIKRCEKRLNND